VFREPLASNGLPCLFVAVATCVIETLSSNGHIRPYNEMERMWAEEVLEYYRHLPGGTK
jgi:hypothetical protein